MLDNILQNN